MTALAAVAMSEHPPAYRERGAEALDALERWIADGGVRRVSGDVTAVCLAARAAAAYGRNDGRRVADAATRAANMASRSAVPALHLALVCWALDDLVPDRRNPPWPTLRGMRPRRAVGPDRALMVYVEHMAAESFDAAGLVRELAASGVGLLRPGPEDGAVLLWLLTAVVGKASLYLVGDNALGALVDQRADLVARLALELGNESFVPPDWTDHAESEGWDGPYLSPIEAFLIDISLSSPNREESWFTYEEARALFGKDAADERLETRRWRAASAGITVLAGGLAGALVYVLARYTQEAPADAAGWAAISVLALVAVVSCVLWRGSVHRDTLWSAVTVGVVTVAIVAPLLLVNALLPNPLFPDSAGLVVGVLAPMAAGAVAAVIKSP